MILTELALLVILAETTFFTVLTLNSEDLSDISHCSLSRDFFFDLLNVSESFLVQDAQVGALWHRII